MGGNSAFIDVNHVALTYKTRKGDMVNALRDVSFTIDENEFVSLIGPSGCGKSTMLKVIAGLLHPQGGKVLVRGLTSKQALAKADFGFVFQDPVLLPWKTAIENVYMPLRILHRKEDMNGRPRELLELVGLAGFGDKYPRELSGGMQQRVSIARALVYNAPILLMDEPFGALDEITRDKMNIDLLKIWSETRKTVLFVTHSIPEAVFLSKKVIVFSNAPALVKAIIEIDLPYPRVHETKESIEYARYVREVRLALGIK